MEISVLKIRNLEEKRNKTLGLFAQHSSPSLATNNFPKILFPIIGNWRKSANEDSPKPRMHYHPITIPFSAIKSSWLFMAPIKPVQLLTISLYDYYSKLCQRRIIIPLAVTRSVHESITVNFFITQPRKNATSTVF